MTNAEFLALLKRRFDVVIPQKVGSNPNQLAFRNNNPGNLRFARQQGATLGDRGFAKFKTPEDGFVALLKQIRLYQNRGLTLAETVFKYAPPNENNTNVYLEKAKRALNCDGDTALSKIDPLVIARFIASHESVTKIRVLDGEAVA